MIFILACTRYSIRPLRLLIVTRAAESHCRELEVLEFILTDCNITKSGKYYKLSSRYPERARNLIKCPKIYTFFIHISILFPMLLIFLRGYQSLCIPHAFPFAAAPSTTKTHAMSVFPRFPSSPDFPDTFRFLDNLSKHLS